MYVSREQYKMWKQRFHDFLDGAYVNDKNDANANNNIARPTLLKNYIWGNEMKEFGIKLMLEEAGFKNIDEAYKKYIESKLIYIHDAGSGKVFKPYCFAFETKNVRLFGLPISPEPKSPAKHANVFVDHVAMLIHNLSQVFAGAITPIDFLIELSYFTKNLSDKEVKQLIQMFMHIINDDIREVDGSPFVNINIFDKPALKRLFDVPDEQIPEVDRVQRLFIDEFTERPRNGGRPWTFPVVTLQISFDEEGNVLDEDYLELASTYPHLWYIYHNYGDIKAISTCCRLRNDLSFIQEVTKHKIGSLGTANAQIGSHRVISLNIPKILEKGGFALLDDILENVVYPLLKAHRKIMHKEIEKGVLPYFRCKKYDTVEKGGWFDLDTMFFSTVGIIGLYEGAVVLAGSEEDKDALLKWEKEIAKFIREKTDKWSKQDLLPYGVELVPAENAGAVLSDTHIPLSTQYIPFWKNEDVYTRLKFAGEVDEYCNGGTVTFLPVGNIPKQETVKQIIRFAGRKRVYYYTFNPIYTMCNDCGETMFGKVDKCMKCGSKNVDYFTRVTGWYTKVSNWNDKKKNEFKIRQLDCVDVDKSDNE
jgi:ribonucleoside-triphosphate reductase